MTRRPDRTLVPRDGHTLRVCVVARISGCSGQQEVSLDDQVDHAKQVVGEMHDGLAEYQIIATKGKGERLDRPELEEIEAEIRSGDYDLLIAEDLGRIVRGAEALRLCGIAVDKRTRVIAPNDGIDTADPNWESDVYAACKEHAGHNAHTSKRIKQRLMNRFEKSGGAVPLPVFGYIKPEGSKTFDEWEKDPAATPIYREWFERLRGNRNCTAVADWLNATGVPTGPYAERKTWDGQMVRRLTKNPLLKGIAGRGFKRTVKENETGRRLSVKNPDGPVFRECPHLAHVDSSLWDEVNELLNESNKGFGRKPVNGTDPRWQVARKRTRFPGQHAHCHYCGRQFVWGGNGMAHNLMCNGSRSRQCWNSFGFSGELAAAKIVETITAELVRLEGFDDQLRAMAEEALRSGVVDQTAERARLEKDESDLARGEKNLTDAIFEKGAIPMLMAKVSELEARKRELARRRRELDRALGRPPELPASAGELRRLFEEKAKGLAADSPEFGDVLRLLVPQFHVHLVRSIDGGHPLPRARIRLCLAGIVTDAARVPAYGDILTRELEIDLFEPSQRERIRAEAARLAADGLRQRDIAARLPGAVSQTAVGNALALDRMMRERGLDSPYVTLASPPEDYVKLCRHKNPKYRFEPEEGYEPPPL